MRSFRRRASVSLLLIAAVLLSGAGSDSNLFPTTGFAVEIDVAGSGNDVDTAWESVSGGAVHLEQTKPITGADQHQTTTPGHKYIDTLTLRGPITAGRTSGNAGTDEILQNGAGRFKVEIDGLPATSAKVHTVTMEDLAIDVREMTTGADWDYRVYGPAATHWGNITIASRTDGGSRELQQWWNDAAQGKNIRKSISVILLRRDGSEARTYNLMECFPTAYTPFSFDGSTAVETMVLSCGRISFEGESRKALLQWINETTRGKEWKRDLTLTELNRKGDRGRTFTYIDCFPVAYRFPALSAAGTGNLYEEVSIKPIRLELK